jgi:hypothetical protein
MYLLYSFVQEFSENIDRKIDSRFAPTSGGEDSEEVKRMMEESQEIINQRK